jgi:hypothetical protein
MIYWCLVGQTRGQASCWPVGGRWRSTRNAGLQLDMTHAPSPVTARLTERLLHGRGVILRYDPILPELLIALMGLWSYGYV